jgi:acyl-CoA synthetase (AMP-forming)/AMP-acid ligase II
VIVLKEGMQGDKEEFLNYCKENMPDYRVPKTILLRDAIPRNPAGKILKRVLKRDAQTG